MVRLKWVLLVGLILLVAGCSGEDAGRKQVRGGTQPTATTSSGSVQAEADWAALGFAEPVGELWRSISQDAPISTTALSDSDWPESVVALITEQDSFQPLVGDINQYPVAQTVGDRELHRRPAQDGPGDRLWVEPDGRMFSVSLLDRSTGSPAFDPETWATELSDMLQALSYSRGEFAVDEPYELVEDSDGEDLGQITDGSFVGPADSFRWRVGDDRFMLTGYRDTDIDVTDLNGEPIEVRGHEGRLGEDWLVWREDADTLVVVGNSTLNLDPIMRGEVRNMPFYMPLDRSAVEAAVAALSELPASTYSALPTRVPDRAGVSLLAVVPPGMAPVWIRVAHEQGGVSSVAAGSDGAPISLTAEDGTTRLWAAKEPYGPWDVPDCSVQIDARAIENPPEVVEIPSECVIPARDAPG